MFRVRWFIDIDADSPQEAAEKALAIQRNPESIATHFKVKDENGKTVVVDFDPDDEENDDVRVR